ncbi:IclR family transcriptional regulator [Actinophytocola sp.]|uniref:IclR family transcriptional regulator n=1 Tax=Actinophytocola sp. TaxID=1872138 RepID=UPI003899C285
MRDRAPQPTDLIQSVSRAFRIMEEVGGSRAPLTVKAIARRCQLNLSTAYHLVRTLTYEGYLVRSPDGGFVLGSSVARRFHDLLASFDQPPRVREVLRHLAATTQRTAYLGRFVSGRIMITDMVEGPLSPHLEDLEVGLDVAAHATVVGKVLLSTLSRARRTEYLAEQGMRRFTARTVVDAEALDHELSSIGSGPVSEHGQFRDGVSCAGTLIRRESPETSWAIVTSTREDEMPPEVVWHTVRAAEDLAPVVV